MPITDNTQTEETDYRRRELLNMMKGVVIAGPILLTLKNTPARAHIIGEGSCLSADNSSAHEHPTEAQCIEFQNDPTHDHD